MRKKLISLFLLTVFLIVTLCGCALNGSKDGVREIRLSVITSDESSWGVMAHNFADLIEERTNGRYKVSVYANDQLGGGDTSTILSMLQMGSIDMEIHSLAAFSPIEPKSMVLMTPWLFDNYDDVDVALGNTAGDTLKQMFEQHGITILGFGESGFRQVCNTERPITSPEDMVGLKIRTPPTSVFIDMYKALGADPVGISNSEVFMSIQQGTVDGAENFTDLIYTGKYYEICDYMTVYNSNYDCATICMSQKTFESLPDEDKDIFISCAEEAAQQQKTEFREKEAKLIEEMSQYMQVTYPTEEELQVFKSKMTPVYEKYAEIYGEELLTALGVDFSR